MILKQGDHHVFIATQSPVAKAGGNPTEAIRIHRAAADAYLGAVFVLDGKAVGQVVGFVAEWPYAVQKSTGLAPDTAYMDLELTDYGQRLVSVGRWDSAFPAMEVRPIGGIKKAKKLRKALRKAAGPDIYAGNATYEAPLIRPEGGGSVLSPYNEQWSLGRAPGYGHSPEGYPDVGHMNPVAQVEALGNMLATHGSAEFHRHARTIHPDHLRESALHAHNLGNDRVCTACLRAADDSAYPGTKTDAYGGGKNPALSIATLGNKPDDPTRPVHSADAGEMLEGVDLTTPTGMTIGQQRYAGFRPRVKKHELTQEHIVKANLPGLDPHDPADLNWAATGGPECVGALVKALSPSEAAALAVSPRVEPDVRRILAARGRR